MSLKSKFGILCVVLILLNKTFLEIHGWVGCNNLLLLLHFHLLRYNHFQRPFRIDIINLTTVALSPKCRANASLTNSAVISVNIQLLDNIKKPFSYVAIFLESSSGTYDMEIMNRTIDMCRFYRDIKYEPILQVGVRLFQQASSFPTLCPIRKVSFKFSLMN